MDLSPYFHSSMKPVEASLDETQVHPEVVKILLERHRGPQQTAVPWEKVKLHLGL